MNPCAVCGRLPAAFDARARQDRCIIHLSPPDPAPAELIEQLEQARAMLEADN